MKSLNESILNSFKEAFLLEDYKSAKVKLIEKGMSEDEADSLIARHKELKKLNRLDKSLIDIDVLVKNFSPEEIKQKLFNISTQTKSEIKKRVDGKIVGENDEYLVYKIDTPEEAYRFHGLTKWCICSGTEEQARAHFNHYLNGFKNTFYFFVRKNITDPNDEWNYIALQRNENESKDNYWSMFDKPCNLSEIPVNLPEFDKPPLEPFSAEERFIKAGFKKNADGEFDVDGDFILTTHAYLIVDGKLAVKFGKVSGNFNCSNYFNIHNPCDLTSLEGCPREVGGSFYCRNWTNLKNLKGCPEKVGEDFDCSRCSNLMSLEGCPKMIGGNFRCDSCFKLTNLKGCPEKVGKHFSCAYCDGLTNLEGCPEKVGLGFYCYDCDSLKSLEGCPEKVDDDFVCYHCRVLKSLEGCPKEVGGIFNCENCAVKFTEDEVRSLCDVSGKIVC